MAILDPGEIWGPDIGWRRRISLLTSLAGLRLVGLWSGRVGGGIVVERGPLLLDQSIPGQREICSAKAVAERRPRVGYDASIVFLYARWVGSPTSH